MNSVKISTDYITLGQLLKYIGVVSNGGEVKNYLEFNEVFVNNELEKRRGRKIFAEYIIKIGKNTYKIVKNDC